MPHRYFVFVAFLFGVLSSGYGIEEYADAAGLEDAELDAELDEIIFGSAPRNSPFWSSEGYVSTGYGYRENVLLSQANELDSPFVFVGVEAMGIRSVPDESDEWFVLLMLENSRFFDIEDFENETLLFAQVHYARKWRSVGTFGLGLEHMYSSQAFDASLDEIDEASSLVVKGNQTTLSTDFKFRESSVLKMTAGRMAFDEESSDYDLGELSYFESFALGPSSELEFSLKGVDRDYVNRFARDDAGVVIEGTFLQLREWRSRVSVSRSHPLWRGEGDVKVFADYSQQSSVASAYYDRALAKFGTRLKWAFESWCILAGATYYRADYDARLGEDGRERSDDDWRWSFELERSLANDWSLYLQFNSAEKETNESLSSYQTNTFMLGVRLPSIRL